LANPCLPSGLSIETEVNGENNGYNFKIDLECSKDGESFTTTVTGYINMNSNGKMTTI